MPTSFRTVIRAAIVVLGLASPPLLSASAQTTTLDSVSLGADRFTFHIPRGRRDRKHVLTLTLYGDPDVMRRCHKGTITDRWVLGRRTHDLEAPAHVRITYPPAATLAAREIWVWVGHDADRVERQLTFVVAKGTCFAADQRGTVTVSIGGWTPDTPGENTKAPQTRRGPL